MKKKFNVSRLEINNDLLTVNNYTEFESSKDHSRTIAFFLIAYKSCFEIYDETWAYLLAKILNFLQTFWKINIDVLKNRSSVYKR